MVHEGSKGRLVRDTTRAIRVEAAKIFDDGTIDADGRRTASVSRLGLCCMN